MPPWVVGATDVQRHGRDVVQREAGVVAQHDVADDRSVAVRQHDLVSLAGQRGHLIHGAGGDVELLFVRAPRAGRQDRVAAEGDHETAPRAPRRCVGHGNPLKRGGRARAGTAPQPPFAAT